MEQRDFIRAGLEYVCLIQEVQERKKFEFVETVRNFNGNFSSFLVWHLPILVYIKMIVTKVFEFYHYVASGIYVWMAHILPSRP